MARSKSWIAACVAIVVAAALAEKPAESSPEPLSEIESKLYCSAEERDADQAALALAKQKLEVQIYQLVRFLKDGKPAPMRKRDGNIYALIDLINEIGAMVKPNGTEEEKQTAGHGVLRRGTALTSIPARCPVGNRECQADPFLQTPLGCN